jgi:hypothetical protein
MISSTHWGNRRSGSAKNSAAITSLLNFAALAAANLLSVVGALAEDPKAMFKDMSDYLVSQSAILIQSSRVTTEVCEAASKRAFAN